MRRLITNLLLALLCLASPLLAQDMRMDTYCNPLNVDYTYMIYNSSKDISYRSGADPAVVEFRGEYYMFVTRTRLLAFYGFAKLEFYQSGGKLVSTRL